MASSLLRRISQKATANVRGLISPAKNSLLRTYGLIESKNARISSSPWLMLPPSFEGNNSNVMAFNFYDFAEKRVRKVVSERVEILANDLDDISFVSSSHGWLALFNKRNLDLFLFNPLSGRQIKLPSIKPLIYVIGAGTTSSVIKVITSCSPEYEDCRVMMSFGYAFRPRLAICSPSSAEWTYNARDPICYNDFVYSSNRKRFYCLTNSLYFEALDVRDTKSPKFIDIHPQPKAGKPYPVGGAQSEEQLALQHNCRDHVSLVVADECGDLFWVRRYVVSYMDTDGSYVEPWQGSARNLPYMTIGFDVYKYDPENGELVYMDGSLDGSSLFIGNNHSFAVSASDFPEFKPNSIYFTDHMSIPEEDWRSYGGHDVGIFNYENKSFSPCYYPCDRQSIKRIMPSPMWFTPTY